MKKIGNFLFVEQCFTDTEETKPCVIHIDAIDSITCGNTSKLGEQEFSATIQIISSLNLRT